MSKSRQDATVKTRLGLDKLFEGFQPDTADKAPVETQKAVFLARVLQQRASHLQTPQERRQQAELDRMMQNPGDKVTLLQLTDQAFRSNRPDRKSVV
jgi:RHH-type proline utilization regulon transcriptional repressor/proline dehydrogenase/delta 1-pyrroline-5-carboxylate dehydrogenase